MILNDKLEIIEKDFFRHFDFHHLRADFRIHFRSYYSQLNVRDLSDYNPVEVDILEVELVKPKAMFGRYEDIESIQLMTLLRPQWLIQDHDCLKLDFRISSIVKRFMVLDIRYKIQS